MRKCFPSVNTLNAQQDVLFVHLARLGHLVKGTGGSNRYILQPRAEPANRLVIGLSREHYKIAGNIWSK